MTVSRAELVKTMRERVAGLQGSHVELGRVLSVRVGDGLARIYGLKGAKVGQMVALASGHKGLVLSASNDVGLVFFADSE